MYVGHDAEAMRLKREYSVIPTPEQLADIDFSDHSTLTTAVWGVNVAFLILVAIVVVLRMYTRACITRQFFTDDSKRNPRSNYPDTVSPSA